MVFGRWYLVLDSKLVTYQKNITKKQKTFFIYFYLLILYIT